MNTKTSKITSILVAIAIICGVFTLMPQTAHAASVEQLAFEIQNFWPGGTGLLFTEMSGKTVIVTGTVTGATEQLDIEIDPGVTVIWKANYSGTVHYPKCLISLSGTGAFEVVEGSIRNINDTATDCAIRVNGANTVDVRGGIVEGKTAILALAANAKITVSGGEVKTSAGNGCYAIYTGGESSTVTVSGGTVKAEKNFTGMDLGRVIYINGEKSKVVVNGGTVCTMGDYGIAIFSSKGSSSVEVNGGFVFGMGYKIIGGNAEYCVISTYDSSAVISDGIVCAWNKPYGTPEYFAGTSKDLTVNTNAGAVWGIHPGILLPQNGIVYSKIGASGGGFFPIDGIIINILGDVNDDGKVDATDIKLLKEYLHGITAALPKPENADLDGDGVLTAFDLAVLRNLCLE